MPGKKSYSQIERSPLHHFSSTCSSTRDSRTGSLDKTSSQASNQSPSKDDSLVSDIKSSQSSTERCWPAAHCTTDKATLFQLFNSKVLLADDLCESELPSRETTPAPAEEPFDVSEAEVRAILGKDLAELILVKQCSGDSVS